MRVALKSEKSFSAKQTWNGDPRDLSLELGMIVSRHKVVIPNTLRKRLLDDLHTGHFGIVKMKLLARRHAAIFLT